MPDDRASIRNTDGRVAFLQRFWPTASAFKSVYRRVSHLHVALAERQAPLIYEDGYQRRDFVSVADVVQACRLALEVPEPAAQVFNVGSGRHFTVRALAGRIAALLGKEHIQPEISGRYRVGDVRHCFADITLARQVLGYEPQVTLDDGLQQFASWVESEMNFDHCAEAYTELEARGLTR